MVIAKKYHESVMANEPIENGAYIACSRDIFVARRDMIIRELADLLTDVRISQKCQDPPDHLYLIASALEEIQHNVEPISFCNDEELNQLNMAFLGYAITFIAGAKGLMNNGVVKCHINHVLY